MKQGDRVAPALLIPLGMLAVLAAISSLGEPSLHGREAVGVLSSAESMDPPGLSVAGVDSDWWERTVGEINNLEYQASWTAAGLQAPNRAHNLRVHFHPDGVRITPRTDPTDRWSWCWSTRAWGREGRMRTIEPT